MRTLLIATTLLLSLSQAAEGDQRYRTLLDNPTFDEQLAAEIASDEQSRIIERLRLKHQRYQSSSDEAREKMVRKWERREAKEQIRRDRSPEERAKSVERGFSSPSKGAREGVRGGMGEKGARSEQKRTPLKE